MTNRTAGEGGREVWLRQEWPFLVALALMGLVIFFYRLGVPGLMDPDEGRYGEIAREMVTLKEWLIPHLNLSPYLEKPPLVYWLSALSYKVLGPTEWAVRLPSAVSALGGLFLAYGLGRALWGPAPGFIGATVLATCSGYVVLGRLLTLDMTFSLLVNVAIGLGYLALSRERRELWPWAYGALGLAVLTKGPVALVLAGLIWGLWVIFISPLPQPSPLKGEGVKGRLYLRLTTLYQWRLWRPLVQPRGWLILAVMVLPWFAYLQWRFPEYFRFFILEQHFSRFLTPAIHPEPFYYFGPVLLGLLLPWTFLLPWALFSRSEGEGRDPDRAFLLIWAGVVVVFFSLSRGKLAPYILPALLPLALLLGKRLQDIVGEGWSWHQLLKKELYLAVSLWFWAAAGAIMLGLLFIMPAPLSQALTRSNLPPAYLVLVAAIFTLTPILTMAGRRFALLFLGAGALVLSTLVPMGLDRLSLQRSPRELGRLVQSLWQPGAALVGVRLYSQGLSFYSGQAFHLLDFRTELDFGRKLKAEKGLYFASVKEMADFAGSRPKVFLYVKEHDLESLRAELPGKIQLLARQRDCLLLAYQRE